jgi:hypothetical protein
MQNRKYFCKDIYATKTKLITKPAESKQLSKSIKDVNKVVIAEVAGGFNSSHAGPVLLF